MPTHLQSNTYSTTYSVCVEQYTLRCPNRCSGKLSRKIIKLRGFGWARFPATGSSLIVRCGNNAESSVPERTAGIVRTLHYIQSTQQKSLNGFGQYYLPQYIVPSTVVQPSCTGPAQQKKRHIEAARKLFGLFGYSSR